MTCVRELVRRAVDNRLTEVALWGEGWPLGVNRGLTRTQYRLSAAARAFKGQALARGRNPLPFNRSHRNAVHRLGLAGLTGWR